jgi:7,8-dihydropterin-6-yl-methyl-4-(beta-D-ribofuranosyl)aminobenzene 5'-phosphate synthase
MIRDAQEQDPTTPGGLIVDLHPERPDYRGFQFPGQEPVSLQAVPTFAEIEAAGAKIEKSSKPHTVLDNMFLISGEIPRVTP